MCLPFTDGIALVSLHLTKISPEVPLVLIIVKAPLGFRQLLCLGFKTFHKEKFLKNIL